GTLIPPQKLTRCHQEMNELTKARNPAPTRIFVAVVNLERSKLADGRCPIRTPFRWAGRPPGRATSGEPPSLPGPGRGVLNAARNPQSTTLGARRSRSRRGDHRACGGEDRRRQRDPGAEPRVSGEGRVEQEQERSPGGQEAAHGEGDEGERSDETRPGPD